MSIELDTLDQLAGGDMPLPIIRGLYADDGHFARAIHALLVNAEVRLQTRDGVEVEQWCWRELFVDGAIVREMATFHLAITDKGIRRIR